MGYDSTAHAIRSGHHSSFTQTTRDFPSLGLRPAITNALHRAFPNVRHPTATQAQFIPAILGGQDVLLKDNTGCGKTFGLIMTLLSKPRRRIQSSTVSTNEDAIPNTITSLVIVPHRDLAYQILHWIQRVVDAAGPSSPPLPSIAQVLVRDGLAHLTSGISTLKDDPPHILIGTPGALLDVMKEDREALRLETLSTVFVDEVDYLIETLPHKEKESRKMREKARKKLERHPSVTKQLLDAIFAPRIQAFHRARDMPEENVTSVDNQGSYTPQLILASATLRNHLRQFLYRESGWLREEGTQKVRGSSQTSAFMLERSQDGSDANSILGGTSLLHHVLVVKPDGSIENIQGAISNPVSPRETEDSVEQSGTTQLKTVHRPLSESKVLEANTQDELDTPSTLPPHLIEQFNRQPSPFNPSSLEAIATSFALDVPSVALLVLPSSAPVHRAVFDLRELGVNALGLDFTMDDRGRTHLLRGDATNQDNPQLLVATLATVRGLDLPELTHVFILGVPEGHKVRGKSIDAYLHIAGRVGRFGRGGQIITVVEGNDAPDEAVTSKEQEGGLGAERAFKQVDDVTRMRRILEEIWVKPTEFSLFE
jgi:superfamily II DNA/RNA helicase